MKTIIENINIILADWNPIGVPYDIATDEYKGYIPLLLRFIENRQQLIDCLEDILINKIGLSYDPYNKQHSEDLVRVCEKLMKEYAKNSMQ